MPKEVPFILVGDLPNTIVALLDVTNIQLQYFRNNKRLYGSTWLFNEDAKDSQGNLPSLLSVSAKYTSILLPDQLQAEADNALKNKNVAQNISFRSAADGITNLMKTLTEAEIDRDPSVMNQPSGLDLLRSLIEKEKARYFDIKDPLLTEDPIFRMRRMKGLTKYFDKKYDVFFTKKPPTLYPNHSLFRILGMEEGREFYRHVYLTLSSSL